jgi:hypothetical protein
MWEPVHVSLVGAGWWDERTVCTGISTSKLQARAEVEAVAFDAVADAEVMVPARAKVEVALTQLRGVGNDRANAAGAPAKTVERVGRCACIVRHLLEPALDEADSEAVLESFDGQHFQVGKNAVLITRCVIHSGCSIMGRIRSQPFDRNVEP